MQERVRTIFKCMGKGMKRAKPHARKRPKDFHLHGERSEKGETPCMKVFGSFSLTIEWNETGVKLLKTDMNG